MVNLLNEQKQTIIHHAITRGLNADVAMRESGVDWIGEIPAHWKVVRLKYLIDILTGFPFPSRGFTHSEQAVRLLRGVNVTPSGIRWDSVVYWKRLVTDNLDSFELRIGDIVLGMDRPIVRAGVRASAIEKKDTPCLLLQRVARLRANDHIDSNFLLLLLKGQVFARYMTPIFTGISVPHLSPKQITDFKVILPPIEEQIEIVNFIRLETSSLNIAAERAEREIKLLQEYRARLVADVATGQLDVREVVEYLPESQEEYSDGIDELEGEDSELEEEILSEE